MKYTVEVWQKWPSEYMVVAYDFETEKEACAEFDELSDSYDYEFYEIVIKENNGRQ